MNRNDEAVAGRLNQREERKELRQTRLEDYMKITKTQVRNENNNEMKIIHINVNGIQAKK